MFNDDGHSKEVARVLELALARSEEMGTDQIIQVFDEAEAACLELVSAEEFRLEVKRRVAEWKMKLHCFRDSAFGTVESLRKDVIGLGYMNLETEANLEIFFAQYCERRGRLKEARQVLQQFRTKLESTTIEEAPGVCRFFNRYAEEILSRIDAQEPQ